MFSSIPIWLLPVWTLGVPLIWAIVDYSLMPKVDARRSSSLANDPLGDGSRSMQQPAYA